MIHKFFDKMSATRADEGHAIKMTLEKLAKEFHNFRKYRKRKIYSSFKDNIWGEDLADMQLRSNCNIKWAWAVPLKDKKGIIISNSFQTIISESGRKRNKIWVEKCSEFYNRSIKLWLQDNNIEMYSTHNELKSVASERFIRTLKNKKCIDWQIRRYS